MRSGPIGVSRRTCGGRYGSFRRPAELDRPGAQTAADTVDRAEAAQKVAAEMGGSLEIYWTMGQYDIVAVTEFADDETAVAFLAKVSSLGNVRSQTMRAFDADAVKSIVRRRCSPHVAGHRSTCRNCRHSSSVKRA